jgi:hypothetical protein
MKNIIPGNWANEKHNSRKLYYVNERKPSTSIDTHISHICIFNIQIRGHQDKFHLRISQISITANDITDQK